MTQDPVFFFRDQPVIETERLRIREIRPDDAEAMFAMDSDPEVHRYLGDGPAGSIDEITGAIEYIHSQYESVGIGRWAAADRETPASRDLSTPDGWAVDEQVRLATRPRLARVSPPWGHAGARGLSQAFPSPYVGRDRVGGR